MAPRVILGFRYLSSFFFLQIHCLVIEYLKNEPQCFDGVCRGHIIEYNLNYEKRFEPFLFRQEKKFKGDTLSVRTFTLQGIY